jgi:hypothetical protein
VSTALSTYYAFAASSTLSTANKLYTGTGGSPTTAQNLTTINGSTGFGEIPAQGSASAWAAGGSIGSPTGKGFFLDATTLDGQDLIAGNYSGIIRFNTQATGTVTADIYVRVHRYHPGTTTYTQIVSMVLTAQSITNTITSYSLPSTSVGSNTSFATGDKLYIDTWLNITTNTSSAGQQIKHNRQSTDTTTFVGDTQAVTVTPGYNPSGTVVQKNLSVRALLSAIGQKDLSMRARVSAIGQKNLSLRTRLSALSLKNLSTRTLLSAIGQKNLSSRTLISAIGQKNLSLRAIINSANNVQKNLSIRALLSAIGQKNLSTRARLSAIGQKDLSLRAILGVLLRKDLSLRALISATGKKDLSLRILIAGPVNVSRVASQTGSFYAGTGGMLPIAIPSLPYIINTLTLDTPSICTAPMASNSVMVPAGSVFTLTFVNPSALTQALLTTYTAPTMTFALYTGEQVTTTVSIHVITGSAIWQALFTTLVATQVTRWKVQSQFP